MRTLSHISLLAVTVLVLSVFVLSFQDKADNRSLQLNSTKVVSIPAEDKDLILETLTRACQLSIKAGATFDISEFPTVFVNDPRFTVRLSDYPLLANYFPNTSVETAGYLDYKIAYYRWWEEGTLRLESIQQTMKDENRDYMTSDEVSFLQETGIPPARISPEDFSAESENCSQIIVTLLEVKDDFAIVVVEEGATTSEHYLVKKNGQWCIIGRRIVKLAP